MYIYIIKQNEQIMNDLRIIITEIKQLCSQTVKTKIKRFLLRKRKLRNVTLFPDFQTSKMAHESLQRMFAEIKKEVIQDFKTGKSIPVKY